MGGTPEDETGEADGLPRDLRFLKTLVTVLTVVMIAGVITITGLLVIRLNGGGADGAAAVIRVAPGDFPMPEGVGVLGISVVGDRTVIVGDDRVIRIFDSASGAEVETFALDR